MKKAIIFGYNMEVGGAEKALINVLNILINSYEVDLVLIEKKGPLLNNIPKNVNIIELKTNLMKYVFFRFIPFYRKKVINKIAKNKYDIAIAFMEGRACTFVADLNQKCRKIAWVHNDVSQFNIGISEKEIKKSYNKMDTIVLVSKHSQNSFDEKYPFLKNKTKVVYNLIDEEDILKKSKEFKIKKDCFTFVNVAKMRPQKRHDRLLEATKILKDKGYNIKLWLVGDGPLMSQTKELVKQLELEDIVELKGLQLNPYPYIKEADCFVLSSDHEGYPLVLLESLLLKTKIISTDVSGAREMLKDNQYGLITDINTNALACAMQTIIDNKKLNAKITHNLKNYQGINEKIKQDLKEVLEIGE